MVWVTGYIAIGMAAAVVLWVSLSQALDRQDEHKIRHALADLEAAVSKMPGGMPVALIATVLLWPILAALVLSNRRGH